jgi:heme uptake protein IsdC
MKWFLAVPSLALSLLLTFTLLVSPEARAAATLSDGTYTVDYVIAKAENDSVSMANDYFEKPATLSVKNGKVSAQIQMNHSKWITIFKTPDNDSFVDAKVVSSDSDADTRVVQFNVDDLSKPLIAKIHVTVESVNYDHDYTIRFIFDTKSIKSVGSAHSASGKASEAGVATPEPTKQASAVKAGADVSDTNAKKSSVVDNPKTGDTAPVVSLFSMLLISFLFMAYRIQSKRF